MRPKTGTGADIKPNRSPVAVHSGGIEDNGLNGGSSGDLSELLHALQAMRLGDFSVRMPGGQEGLIGKIADTFNEVIAANERMAQQLMLFTSCVTRCAREFGTEGKLGGQANVCEVTGVWKELTESVNSMASNLTAQVRNIAEVTIAVANGDLSKKITVDVRGEILQLKEAINTMVDQLRSFASEVTRVAREVGT